MKRMLPAFAAVLMLLTGAAAASAEEQWSYAGKTGPEHWGQLAPAYALCGQGANQSPVNLSGMIEAELEPLKFDYTGLVTKVQNTGHSVQATYSAGSFLTAGGTAYELKQIHFHAPSEHLIEGQQFPLEAHFVHVSADGQLAVLAVLYDLGEASSELKKLWRQMPQKIGEEVGMAAQVRAEKLLPENRDYYRLSGSLTTPPCTEGVLWLVLKNQSAVCASQVQQFSEVMGHPNNRPAQPLKSRAVLQ